MKWKISILTLAFLFGRLGPALASEARDMAVDFSAEPEPMIVTPTESSFTFRDSITGTSLTNLQGRLEIVIQDALRLFTGDFYVPDGTLKTTYHFQDAAGHLISLLVSRTFLVEVTAPGPSMKAWFRTFIFLVGLGVAGISRRYFPVGIRSADAS